MNKRGIAFVFLMELILLVGFVTLLFVASSNITTNTAKFSELDVINLALLLERFPSIDGNARYIFTFINENTSVKITQNEVLLARSEDNSYRFTASYQNPISFRLDGVELRNVSQLVFYKIGNTLHVSEERSSTLDSKLGLRKELDHEKPLSITLRHIGDQNTNPRESLHELPFTTHGELFWLHVIPDQQFVSFAKANSIYADVLIYYSLSAKPIATALFNSIHELVASSDSSVTIALVPDNRFYFFSYYEEEVPQNDYIITTVISNPGVLHQVHAGVGRYFS